MEDAALLLTRSVPNYKLPFMKPFQNSRPSIAKMLVRDFSVTRAVLYKSEYVPGPTAASLATGIGVCGTVAAVRVADDANFKPVSITQVIQPRSFKPSRIWTLCSLFAAKRWAVNLDCC
jgi:hypothetical protein